MRGLSVGVPFPRGAERKEEISSLCCYTACGVWGFLGARNERMGWEIWTTQLDEEELVVNGEFVTQTEVLALLFDKVCPLLSGCCK